MIIIDAHTHTKYSFDSIAEPETMVLSAIERNIKSICFTEHLDIDITNAHEDFAKKFTVYFEEMNRLQDKYHSDIDIIIGIEAGYNAYSEMVKRIINSFPFEYIINSIHEHNGIDYYLNESYMLPKRAVYEEYLNLVYESLAAPYRFDAIGHIGFPSRVATYADRTFYYDEHSEILNKLLNKIIEKDSIVEINSNIGTSPHSFLPSEEILNRYYALGGRLITFSSDAHTPYNLGRNYQSTIAKLKTIGFTHLVKCKSGIRELIPIN